MNKYNYILQLFTGYKGKFDKPFIKGEFAYATNSFVAVRIPKVFVPGVEGENEVNIESVFENEAEVASTAYSVPVESMLGILASHGAFMNRHSTCPACGGSGESECFHCGHDTECSECSGKGSFGSQANPIQSIKFSSDNIKLDAVSFNPEYVNLIAVVGSILKEEKMEVRIHNGKARVSFEGVEILVMAKNHS